MPSIIKGFYNDMGLYSPILTLSFVATRVQEVDDR